MGRAATLIDLGVPRRSHKLKYKKWPPINSKGIDDEDETIELENLESGSHEHSPGRQLTNQESTQTEQELVEDPDPNDETFSSVRDSLSILCVMNQYKLSSSLPISEATLRKNIITALFLTDMSSGKFNLDTTRTAVAAELRRLRKRGVVPVLASLGWYFFALGISMYKAFGDVGDNATAHNLALGLLMGWLPVLVAAAIVDRNSVDGEHVATLLNNLMRKVHPYNTTFTKFVGQGRRRWHYGVAHPILSMLERNPERLKRPVDWHTIAVECIETNWDSKELAGYSINYFNKWELVHMLFAWVTLGLSVLGAWYISFNTPTVGLGCRSFSYVMFLVLCTFTGLVEFALYPVVYRPVKRKRTGDIMMKQGWRGYIQSKRFRGQVGGGLYVFEILTTVLLFAAVFMQTTGAFQFFSCRASVIGSHGGYVVFDGVNYVKRFFNVKMYWIIGAVVSSLVLFFGTVWTLREWLTQSYMWSSDLTMARRGLRRVRVWKGFWWGLRWGGGFNLKWLKGGVRWRP
ncbi:hypothetical protein AA313_de0202548 [Arthrobotrys entomopaga]|nr:hypothetical protein AA313_de0202548 [Arthrobotrys entomopaga]